ncbi:hypothetical protein SmJEL517_g02533 [Synchytrium microbalum]|uniref:Eukaryotic translation initiation factor 3 subunit M n=1 Tax=Synchytrium microbalum TaxID=1806994 RepID=A0A507C549_9FUNG|nr:uncharacterized protein SmJEL517_g02533 [Synchytrium microbalum]TPX34812.1 hypothetical protein SmJEL517_g02533 [Synchytrium microbalum]
MGLTSYTFFGEEQSLKLANLIGTLKQEPENGSFYTSSKELLEKEKFTEVLTQYAKESSVLVNVDPKDFESVYNLLVALIKDATASVIPQLIKYIVDPIVATATEKTLLKLRVLSNLYNNLERTSPSRCDVYQGIVAVAAKGGEVDVLIPTLPLLDAWLAEWSVSADVKRQLFLTISDVLGAHKQYKQQSYEHLLKYLSSFPATPESSPITKPYALRAVTEAIRIPQVLDFEDLVALYAVQALKKDDAPLYDLLNIFLNESLAQYEAFCKSHAGFMDSHGLDHEQNLRKMKLLSLATLATSNVHGEVAYDIIAKNLNIDEDDVEMWIIDAIRAGMIDAKMNQLKRVAVITRSTHRVFGDAEWRQLRDKLKAWRSNLSEVLTVLGSTRRDVGEGFVQAADDAVAAVNN